MARSQLDIILRLDDKASAGIKRASKSLTGFEKGALVASGALVALAGATARFVVDSAKLAARVETLGVVTKTLGKNIGLSGRQIREFENAIVDQGITLQAARQSMAQMIQANIDLAKASDIARLAQNAAVIAGVDSSQAFNRVVTTIQTANVRMGRTIGLQLNFNDAYKAAAEELGKTAQELTEVEKAAIRTNHVLEQGTNIAGAYEEAMETAGKILTSFPRQFEKIKVAVGDGVLPVWTRLVEGTYAWVSGLADLAAAKADVVKGMALLELHGVGEAEVMRGVEEAQRGVTDGITDFNQAVIARAKGVQADADRWIALGEGYQAASEGIRELGVQGGLAAGDMENLWSAATPDPQKIIQSITETLAYLQSDLPAIVTAVKGVGDAFMAGLISKDTKDQALEDLSLLAADAEVELGATASEAGTSIANALGIGYWQARQKYNQHVLNPLNALDGRTIQVFIEYIEGAGVSSYGKGPGVAHGGSFTVPPGFPNDSYPMRVSSGESVSVSNDSRSFFGGSNVNINNGTDLEAFEAILKQVQ